MPDVPDIRTTARPLLRRFVLAVAAVNAQHPWSHNDHYHGWILRHLPRTRRNALDVGCGEGALLLRLAERFERVDGVEVDDGMVRAARRATAQDGRISVRHGDFLAVTDRYDLVVMVASLHHLDLEPALLHARRLLRDGGRLLVVGLARPSSPADVAWDLVSAVLNVVMGLLKHPRRAAGPRVDPFPVRPPAQDLTQIRSVVADVLPRARVRRRVFFRHTIAWTKPGAAAPSGGGD